MSLFRYRSFNKQFVADELERGQVYHWRVSDQNDPQEGFFRYDTRVTMMRMLIFLHRTRAELANFRFSKDKTWLMGLSAVQSNEFKDLLLNVPQSRLPALAREFIARGHLTTEQGRAAIAAGHARMLDRTLISCFSTNRDSPAMFAHYAANHSGLCIEYAGQNPNLFKVSYRSTPSVLGLLETRSEVVFPARVLSKHNEWSYEAEVRHVLYDVPPGLYEVPGLRISDVILGVRANSETTAATMAMIKSSRFPSIRLWTLQRSESTYGFDREQIY